MPVAKISKNLNPYFEIDMNFLHSLEKIHSTFKFSPKKP